MQITGGFCAADAILTVVYDHQSDTISILLV